MQKPATSIPNVLLSAPTGAAAICSRDALPTISTVGRRAAAARTNGSALNSDVSADNVFADEVAAEEHCRISDVLATASTNFGPAADVYYASRWIVSSAYNVHCRDPRSFFPSDG